MATIVTKVFLRFEKKYVLTDGQLVAIIDGMQKYMIPDKYTAKTSGYTIFNNYYDTTQNDLIRHSMTKPYYKEKLRIRSYFPVLSPKDMVFLELKRKIGGIVNKRRARLSYGDAIALLDSGDLPSTTDYLSGQVVSEVEEFLRDVKIFDKVMISYERMAYIGKEDDDFRVTFDRNLLCRRDNLGLFLTGTETHIIPAGHTIMEIKINGAIPLWLSGLLSSCDVFSQSFSKYGTEYTNYINAEDAINA